MSEHAFIEGPWVFHERVVNDDLSVSPACIIGNNEHVVCYVESPYVAQLRADPASSFPQLAQMAIATINVICAAPDLLAALTQVIEAITHEEFWAAQAKARVALAKATTP